jgi:Uncharacterized conserved protein
MILRTARTLSQRVVHRLRFDPGDLLPATGRMLKLVARRAAMAAANRALDRSHGYIEHFGVHRARNNAGDTVLFDSVERLFDSELGPFRWRLSQLRLEVKPDHVERINRSARAVLVGGGGLFTADSNPNPESGWQWRISLENLRQLQPPLILFAVGYNQFRNAESFNAVFESHLQETVRKSVFVGLRNSGSIERVREHLPEELHAKVTFQPCMTTVLNRYYPAARPQGRPDPRDIAVNLAFDRREKRFGTREEEVLSGIARALRHAISRGYRLHAAVHAWDDDPMVEFFRRERIPVVIRRLNLDAPEEVVRFYAGMPLTIGMRGHSQMIPFGCGNAIFSIISHEKMRYFLEDIGEPGWGADVQDPEMLDKIVGFIDRFEGAQDEIAESIAATQRELWEVTQANLRAIGARLHAERDR